MNGFPANDTVFAAIFISLSLYLRAVSYGGVEENQSEMKLNNYYANVYKKYDVVLPIVTASIVSAIFTIYSVHFEQVLNLYINSMVASIIYISCISLIIILTLLFQIIV